MQRFYLLLFLLALCSACHKEEFNFSLTAETQTGANTFSCLKDGQVFVPYGKRCVGFGGGCMEGINAYYSPKRGQLQIQVVLYAAGRRDELLSIDADSIFQPGELHVAHPTRQHYSSLVYDQQDKYAQWSSKTDVSIFLTRLDTIARIISGRFRGTLLPHALNATAQQQTVSVMDGRFDVSY
jgi:hypothetical protein